MNNNYTYKLDDNLYEIVRKCYKQFKVPYSGNYIVFSAKHNGVSITIYENKKGEHKVTFSGRDALEESHWCFGDLHVSSEQRVKKHLKYKALNEGGWLDEDLQIGSDEVGVGDLFMPMIVVAAAITPDDMYFIASMGIKDSKKMSDEYILANGKKVVSFFKDKFSKCTLSNEKYNEMIAKGENLNSLKARMHNQVLLNMHKKHKEIQHFYVDQFVNEKKYFEYLAKDKNIIDNIIFMEKGETYYPSVALASFIARYSLLLYKEKLNESYGLDFPLGAGINADKFAVKFAEEYGVCEYKKVAKANFRNSRDIFDKFGDFEDDLF